MPRGGKRRGTPGASYTNRSDLQQAVRTAPSKSYGEAAASARAQDAVPLPKMPQPSPGGVQDAAPAGPIPGAMPLDRPTDRPNEPLTAGLPIGPGPGPSAAMPSIDPVVETLRAALRAFPNQSTAALLEAIEGRS